MPDNPGLDPNLIDPNSGGINYSQPGGVAGANPQNAPTVEPPGQIAPGGPLDPLGADLTVVTPNRTNPPEDLDYSGRAGDPNTQPGGELNSTPGA